MRSAGWPTDCASAVESLDQKSIYGHSVSRVHHQRKLTDILSPEDSVEYPDCLPASLDAIRP